MHGRIDVSADTHLDYRSNTHLRVVGTPAAITLLDICIGEDIVCVSFTVTKQVLCRCIDQKIRVVMVCSLTPIEEQICHQQSIEQSILNEWLRTICAPVIVVEREDRGVIGNDEIVREDVLGRDNARLIGTLLGDVLVSGLHDA